MQKTKQLPVLPKLDNLTVPPGYDLEKIGVTQSLIMAFQCCRIRFLCMLNGLRNTAKQRTTAFGTIMHGMLERLYKYKASVGVPSEAIRLKWIEQIKKEEADSFRGVDPQQLEEDIWIAESLFIGYCDYWKKDLKAKSDSSSEHEFAVPFNGVTLRGKIDVRETEAKKKFLWEHKFLSRIEADVLDAKLAMDLQSQLYLLADFIETNEWAQGVKYNIVRKPSLRPYKKVERGLDPNDPKRKKKLYSPETRTEYLQRIRADISARPDFYFIRHRILFTKKDRDDFLKELTAKLNEISKIIDGDLAIYRNQGACLMPWKCDFLTACETGSLALYERGKLFSELKTAPDVRQIKTPKKGKAE